MKIILRKKQLETIMELLDSEKVICEECGWSWKLSDGGDDPFICHKCEHDNEK